MFSIALDINQGCSLISCLIILIDANDIEYIEKIRSLGISFQKIFVATVSHNVI